MIDKKKVLFLTGTRADYGKIKPLLQKVDSNSNFELHVFVTGMHLLSKYGSTYKEIEKDGFNNLYKFINQSSNTTMDIALSNTITGFSNYVTELKPDLIIVHGDRLEALAGAVVGAFNNIKVAHIEGGEVSGTIDESIRHAITKFSHIHFVANYEAKQRVLQLGEKENSIYIIGSPDIDIMHSKQLPSFNEVSKKYELNFDDYAILMYHPVTTDLEGLREKTARLIDALIKSNQNYIVIYPNNDNGNDIILQEYERIDSMENFKIYPSIRFEHFLTLLKNANFIIGNSSAGIREAGIYGVPTIDVGNRQKGRYSNDEDYSNVIHTSEQVDEILDAIQQCNKNKFITKSIFGTGNSSEEFLKVLLNERIWEEEFQKQFIDINLISDF